MRKARAKRSIGLNIKINESIRSFEVRVIDDEGGSLGVMPTIAAIKLAKEKGLDLIEISPNAKPPVAKISDYGQYGYEQKKKQRDIRAKTKAAQVTIKSIQIKPGTGENDIAVKARRSSPWLVKGNRIKLELYLRGRSKYLDKTFMRSRLDRFLEALTVPHNIVDDTKKSPKGIFMIIELDKKAYAKLEKSKKEAIAAAALADEQVVEAEPDIETEAKDS